MEIPIRILVVEDDADVARGTCRALDHAGYATVAASTGAQVLPALREQPAHLVLLDRQLPDVDGLEICRQIKADLALGGVLVVIISGVYKGIEDRVAGLEARADGYIERPISNRELVARVEAFVRIARLNQSLSEHVEAWRASTEELDRFKRLAVGGELRIVELKQKINALCDRLGEPPPYTLNPPPAAEPDALVEAAGKLECQQAEMPLRKRRDHHRYIVQSAMDGFWLVDLQGCVLEVNKTYCQMSGYSESELLAMHVSELEACETVDATAAHIHKIMAQGEDRFESRHRRKDGSRFDVEVSVRYEPAHNEHFVVFLRDITARNQTNVALRESNCQLEFALQGGELGMWDWYPHTGTVIYSDLWARMLEYQPVEVLPTVEFLKQHIHPEDHAAVLERLTGHIEGRLPTYESEHRLRTKSGGWLWVLDHGRVVERDQGGQPARVIGVITNITERKRSELALRESETKFRLLAENIQDVFWVCTPAVDRMLYVSPAFENIWGRTCASLYQQPHSFAEAIHPEDQGRVFATIQEHLQDKWDTKYRIARPDGSLRWILDRGFPIHDESGAVTLRCGVAKDITESQQMEETLRDMNWRMGSIIEGTHLGTWEWNIQTGETVFNEVWAQIIGYTLDELIPISIKTWQMYVHPDDENRSAQLLARHFAGELPYYDYECRMKHKDGHWVWIQDRGRVITRTSDGKPLMMFGTHADITARKQAEEALRGSEARLRAITASATDAIVSINSAGNIVSWNLGAERIFGYTENEACGQLITLLIPSRYQVGHLAGMARMQARGEQHVIGKTVEVAGRHQDGHEFALELSLGEWQVAEGWFYTAIIRDITTRKQAEEKLRDLSIAVEQSPAAIVITDTAGNIEYVNPKFNIVTGYSNAEVLGKNPRILKSGETSPEGYRYLWQTITAGKEWRGEFHNKRKNGELFWESAFISPIRDHTGRITRYMAIKEDISARKQSEADRGLMEIQLRQAQKLESIGQLAAGIAHEINTPTQYIGDNTRFLQNAFKDISLALDHYGRLLQAARQQEVTPELVAATTVAIEAADIAYLTQEVPKSIEQTLQGVARVAKIVRAMKDFSHPGSETKVPTDLNRAIESTVTVAHNEWKYVADLDLALDPQLPFVPCLPGEINQVILNLVINAAHAIGDVIGEGASSKGRIRVSTSRQGDCAEIRIQDTGTGIPEAARGRIFDPFFTTKAVGKGTGQGLTIAHMVVVQQHGGTIEFETELGKGTTFVVRLPLQPGLTPPKRNL